MAVSDEFEGLADSQHRLEFSDDGGSTWNKVPVLQNSDYPEETPVLDDVTPTDAHRKIEVPVDFFEDGKISGQYIYKEGGAIGAKLKKAYDDRKTLQWRLIFEDAPSLNTQFEGLIAKHAPKPENKKKIRVDFEISITSDLKPVTDPVGP